MASLIYNSAVEKIVKGDDLDFEAGSAYKCLLVTGAYIVDKDAHDFRDDITNEVTGSGYTAGGNPVTPTVARTGNNTDVTFSNPSWPNAAFTAAAAVIYRARGGAASADELLAFVDFGTGQISSGGTFSVNFTTPLRFQN